MSDASSGGKTWTIPDGVYTALVTPFRDGEVDMDAFRALIDRQAKAGIDGIVPVGTTGESPTLTHEEKLNLFRTVKKTVGDRVSVIAGTGFNNTRDSVTMTKMMNHV